MNNSVYENDGKSKKTLNVKLITGHDKLIKCVRKPTFVSSKIVNQD